MTRTPPIASVDQIRQPMHFDVSSCTVETRRPFIGGPLMVTVDKRLDVPFGQIFTMSCERLGWKEKKFLAWPDVFDVFGLEVVE